MVLNERQVEALSNTIAHWQGDIRGKLVSGIPILPGAEGELIWGDDLTRVNCYSEHSDLCAVSQTVYAHPDCSVCPYYRYYGIKCDRPGGHWRVFIKDPSVETCNHMIRSMMHILESRDAHLRRINDC